MQSVVFEPLTDGNQYFLLFAAIAAIAAMSLVVSLIKNKKVLSLLSFMALMIFGGGAFMNKLAQQHTDNFTIYSESISTLYGSFHFNDLKSSEIIMQGVIDSPIEGQKMLKLDLKDGTSISFMENLYDIESIKSILDERYNAWTANRQ